MINPIHIMLSLRIRMEEKMERSLYPLSPINEESTNGFQHYLFLWWKIKRLFSECHMLAHFFHSFICPAIIFQCLYFCAVFSIGLVASHLSTAHSGLDCASMHLGLFYSFQFVAALLSLMTEQLLGSPSYLCYLLYPYSKKAQQQ